MVSVTNVCLLFVFVLVMEGDMSTPVLTKDIQCHVRYSTPLTTDGSLNYVVGPRAVSLGIVTLTFPQRASMVRYGRPRTPTTPKSN